MDWDRDVSWSPNESTNNATVDEGSGVTNENGHLDIQQTFGSSKNNVSQQMTFYANVTDVAGNTVSGSTSVIVHQSEYYAGIRSEKYIGRQGESQPFSVVVLDWDSQPIANQKVTVDFVERQWYSVQEKDKQGQLTWVTSVKEIPVSKQDATTGADGIAASGLYPTQRRSLQSARHSQRLPREIRIKPRPISGLPATEIFRGDRPTTAPSA